MSNKNWNRAIFFALGTFFGGWVLGVFGRVLGRA
jgi:hypothetical protein